MKDVIIKIFERYGLGALIGAILGFVLIWGLAHWTAAPGGTVSVLWGIVEYTKKEPLATRTIPPWSSSEAGIVAAENLPSISLELQHDISTEEHDGASLLLRSERNLRELIALETGRPISEVATGTFFFLSSNYLGIDKVKTTEEWNRLPVDRFRTIRSSYFEFHFPAEDTLLLLAFVTKSDGSKIARLSGTDPHQVQLSPYPWGELTTLVSIPIDRLIWLRLREINITSRDRVSILDAVVQ